MSQEQLQAFKISSRVEGKHDNWYDDFWVVGLDKRGAAIRLLSHLDPDVDPDSCDPDQDSASDDEEEVQYYVEQHQCQSLGACALPAGIYTEAQVLAAMNFAPVMLDDLCRLYPIESRKELNADAIAKIKDLIGVGTPE